MSRSFIKYRKNRTYQLNPVIELILGCQRMSCKDVMHFDIHNTVKLTTMCEIDITPQSYPTMLMRVKCQSYLFMWKWHDVLSNLLTALPIHPLIDMNWLTRKEWSILCATSFCPIFQAQLQLVLWVSASTIICNCYCLLKQVSELIEISVISIILFTNTNHPSSCTYFQITVDFDQSLWWNYREL